MAFAFGMPDDNILQLEHLMLQVSSFMHQDLAQPHCAVFAFSKPSSVVILVDPATSGRKRVAVTLSLIVVFLILLGDSLGRFR